MDNRVYFPKTRKWSPELQRKYLKSSPNVWRCFHNIGVSYIFNCKKLESLGRNNVPQRVFKSSSTSRVRTGVHVFIRSCSTSVACWVRCFYFVTSDRKSYLRAEWWRCLAEGCCQGGFVPPVKVWKSATLCCSGIPPSPLTTPGLTARRPKRWSAPWQLCFFPYGLLYYFDDISRPCKLCATLYFVYCRIKKNTSHMIFNWNLRRSETFASLECQDRVQ